MLIVNDQGDGSLQNSEEATCTSGRTCILKENLDERLYGKPRSAIDATQLLWVAVILQPTMGTT